MNHDQESGVRFTHAPKRVERNLLPFHYMRLYIPTMATVYRVVYVENRAAFHALLAAWNNKAHDCKYWESPIRLRVAEGVPNFQCTKREAQDEAEREAVSEAGDSVGAPVQEP